MGNPYASYYNVEAEDFFVQKTEDANAVNFDADRRERGITPERLIVNLTISDNDTAAIDRTRLVMNAKASRSYEMACDASKFISDDAATQLYT